MSFASLLQNELCSAGGLLMMIYLSLAVNSSNKFQFLLFISIKPGAVFVLFKYAFLQESGIVSLTATCTSFHYIS